MNRLMLLFLFVLGVLSGSAQKIDARGYMDSIKAFRADYIQTHELLTSAEQKALLRFYPLDPKYRVVAHFEKFTDSPWFPMATSGKTPQIQRKYGRLTFSMHDTVVHLTIYQSQALMQKAATHDYLFIPFTDATSGIDSYGGGRYIDCAVNDIRSGIMVLDFNKAYNPYCAYATGYNCPIPPRENDLSVAIQAGEKNYGKLH
ncbi:MAG: DUF1684 domain-containing protein [Sphingobacteriales bacterium]|nr:DUF1684 domain-containing protein [Sphingobacteriales bacterium]